MFKNIYATMDCVDLGAAELWEDLCQAMPTPSPPRLYIRRPSKPSSMLLKLPRELRNNIFHQLTYAVYEDHTTPEERHLCPKPLLRHLVGPTLATSPVRGIMQTNAQLRSEFGQELYRHAHEECTITASAAADHGPPPANPFGTAFGTVQPPQPITPNIAPNIAILLAAAQQARRNHHLLRATWIPAAIPNVPHYLAQHLRSFSFTIAIPPATVRRDPFVFTGTHSNNVFAAITFDAGGDAYYRDWNVLHDDFDVAVNSVLTALPVLEELDVAMSLASGSYSLRALRDVRDSDDSASVKTIRVVDFEPPAVKRRREEEKREKREKRERRQKEKKKEEDKSTKESNDGLTRARKKRKTESGAVSGHHDCTCEDAGSSAAGGGHKEAVEPVVVQPGARLKRFKKSMVIRFAGLDDFPFTYCSQEDRFKDERCVGLTRVHRSLDFL